MLTIYTWGIKFNNLQSLEIAQQVDTWISENRKGIHVTGVDMNVVTIAKENGILRDAILDSDIVNIDSFMPSFFLKKKGFPINDRTATPDVFEDMLFFANERHQKVYFLGSKKETLLKMIDVISVQYPNISIIGYHDGYYQKDAESKLVESISNLSPDYLFIGLPSPQKEFFIFKYKKIINTGCLYGVGGAFDAKSGNLPRPPKCLQAYGLEGMLRILRRPIYFGKRFLPALCRFLHIIYNDKTVYKIK